MSDASPRTGARTRTIATTPFGPVVIVWAPFEGGPRVVRVLLSRPASPADAQAAELYPGAPEASCPEVEALAGSLAALLEGEPVEVPLEVAELDACPAFQRLVLRAEHAIPRGRVSTYGLLAAHLGRPAAARAVGNALAGNPFPLIVPCHRAIRSDGRLGGYQGGPSMKRALLAMEGARFDEQGRVRGAALHYAASS
jgi:methylated-DNA-[protein]-cysteine S-methyltransferase